MRVGWHGIVLLTAILAAPPSSAEVWPAVAAANVRPSCDTARSATSMVARTDHQPSGNRVVHACEPWAGDVRVVALPGEPIWLLPDPTAAGTAWLATLRDGSIARVRDGGDGLLVDDVDSRTLEPGTPPVARRDRSSHLLVEAADDAASFVDDVVPDSRAVRTTDGTLVILRNPTERYPHGVLGDAIEASAIEIVSDTHGSRTIEVGDDEVIEGNSPLLADLTGDGVHEILVTVSDSERGARLRVYDLDGSRIAESEAIGMGFRWMHQIGVGPTGPNGEVEVIAVRTPHIGGVVEAYRLMDGQLVRIAAQPGYSSHQLGSANLDMALLADVDADGVLEVVVPTQAMDELAILSRTTDGFEIAASLPLGGALVSNVAAAVDADGRLSLAAATDEGRLRVFR